MGSVIRYADYNLTELNPSEIPEEIPVIPLRNAVVLPGVLLPVFIGRTDTIDLVEKFGSPGTLVGLFTQKTSNDDQITFDKLHSVGAIGEIHRILPLGDGGYQVFLQGVQKVKLTEILRFKPHLIGRVEPVYEVQDTNEREVKEFRSLVLRYVELHPNIPDDINAFIKRIKNPSSLANQLIFFGHKDIKEKIRLMKINSVAAKIRMLRDQILEDIQRLTMERELREKVEKDASRMQKEFYLRKQMETIRRELGENDDDETNELEQNLKAKNLPAHIQKAVDKELRRLRRAQEGPHGGGQEAVQLRNWLELVLELPWHPINAEKTELSLKKAARILDEDHEGLTEVKEKILEYLAMEKQTGGSKAAILCLVGPPGVGKTSLARSIARAMNRPVVRAALGGVRDEAEIRGHRRTYVGALPGKILSSMKKAETTDPVFLLDEIDKTTVSHHGDPSAALLEVLDPEQNHAFEDHYLGHPYDLSGVLFIATANSQDAIPAPLLDRMEIVKISGYTQSEKKEIARKHLIPEILDQMKLPHDRFVITDDALDTLIFSYTREAGVRSLKRMLQSLIRKALRKMMEESEPDGDAAASVKQKNKPIKYKKHVFKSADVTRMLGRIRYIPESGEEYPVPGIAVGLAWTPVGGEILYVEATSYPGQGHLKLSGHLGDVMKESAGAALSFIRSHAADFGIDPDLFKNSDIHIHIPGGAIPKDGPSAGVTILSALVSLFTDKRVAPDLAMTGEISLRGRILPVGGIKEKVLAAMAAGIHTVYLPEKNRADFEEIPPHISGNIKPVYFRDMIEIVREAVPGSVITPPVRMLPARKGKNQSAGVSKSASKRD